MKEQIQCKFSNNSKIHEQCEQFSRCTDKKDIQENTHEFAQHHNEETFPWLPGTPDTDASFLADAIKQTSHMAMPQAWRDEHEQNCKVAHKELQHTVTLMEKQDAISKRTQRANNSDTDGGDNSNNNDGNGRHQNNQNNNNSSNNDDDNDDDDNGGTG